MEIKNKMIGKQIVIPEVEYMSDKDYADMIEVLESLPINYQIWEVQNNIDSRVHK